MIIGISGKIGSGKDTAAMLLHKLYLEQTMFVINTGDVQAVVNDFSIRFFLDNYKVFSNKGDVSIKKFAAKLKQFVAIATGSTLEELEDQEFKSKSLEKEWWYYGFGENDSTKLDYQLHKVNTTENGVDKNEKYIRKLSYRTILQQLGTEVCRHIHPNFWVNALFADYIPNLIQYDKEGKDLDEGYTYKHPTWIISDVRFPNEAQAIKERGGILIRIERYDITGQGKLNPHTSETALDDYEGFDYIVENMGTIDKLYNKLESLKLFKNV